MNDLIKSFRFEGHVHFHGQDMYGRNVDPVIVRRYIGMVFQQPNPFTMSIFDNVAFGLWLNRFKGDLQAQDPDGETTYPIVTYSWLLLYDRYPNAAKLAALKTFVSWALGEGQHDSTEVGYIPLPEAVATQALKWVDSLHP